MSAPTFPPHAVAVIGIAGRFPKSPTIVDFWRHIRDGIECLSRFSDEELAAAGVPDDVRRQPAFVPVRGRLDDADRFDAGFFGINPREAELIDPQQRLLLECAVEAFEDAGYDWSRVDVPVGVFAGVGANAYLFTQIARADLSAHPGAAYEVFIGNDKDFCATRLSYKLGLRGPSVNVQTACSTSLVAVHLACQSLLNYQCDMALAGAASLLGGTAGGYMYAEGMILSPDGHCRPFDAQARGTVPGEGVGLVMLKRLDDALADNDAVRAVIIGTGVNNDGALKAGFTAPSIDGQREAIGLALAMADVAPEDISYVEAHGTATPLGDPIEIAALTQAYRERTTARGFCALGALKGNIGHTDTVAGVAGLIKTVLALEHREMPPTLHYQAPNPALNLDDSPFFVNATLRPWESGDVPRRAGVSSFGIGGTNAHVIVQEAPVRVSRVPSGRVQVLPLSARSEAALDAATRRLGDAIAARPDLAIADVAYTLQQGRHRHRYRRTVQCRTREEALAAIESGDPQRVRIGSAGDGPRPVVFMFSGQGAQYPGMGAGLYASEPVFRQAIDECAGALKDTRPEDLRDLMLHATGDDAALRLRRTFWAQPALFAIDYALAQLWLARGVDPAGMIGHSLGEYVAATVAGVMDVADAVRLVAERARLMDALPGGAMLVVPLAEGDVLPLLPPGVSIAAVNGPSFVVVSGPTGAVGDLEQVLAGRGLEPRRLHTSHAFHSAMVEPMLEPFRAALEHMRLAPPKRRYVSNVTGTWITDEQAMSATYWLEHVRQPVRFGDGIAALGAGGDAVFLELGPGRTLATLARQAGPTVVAVTSLRHAGDSEDDTETFAAATATLWRHGVSIDWPSTHVGEQPRRVPLPSYPFHRERYWIEAGPIASPSVADETRKQPVDDWFTTPGWRRMERTLHLPVPGGERWLVFDEAGGRVSAALTGEGVAASALVVVRQGESRDIGETMTARPDVAVDYEVVLAEACRRIGPPTRIVFAWGGDAPRESTPNRAFDAFHRTRALTLAVANRLDIARARIDVVLSGSASVLGNELIAPDRAAVHGLARVISQEYPHLRVSVVDFATDGTVVADLDRVVDHLLAPDAPTIAAVRGSHRWELSFDRVACPAPEERPRLLDLDGTYLVTGAFGNIGAQLCQWLVDEGVRRLVLIGRRAGGGNASSAADGSGRVVDVSRLRDRGVDVLALQVDMANPEQVRGAAASAMQHFGRVSGVFHCAGTVQAAPLPDLTPEECDRQFGGKCLGLWALLEAFNDTSPDFVACTSSISVALGGLGFGAYAAANAALDASVEAFPSHNVISIGWDSWDPRDQPGAAGPLAIVPDEGRQAWRRILDAPRAHVIVSTTDLVGRMQRWAQPAPAAKKASVSQHARPSLSVAYAAPTDDVESQMVAIWEDLLGITGIGVHDDFFELGGHSLLGTQLISRVRDHFSVQLPLRAIFDASTVQGLARHVSGVQWVTSAAGPPDDASAEDREEVEL